MALLSFVTITSSFAEDQWRRLRRVGSGGGGTCDAANVAAGASNCPLRTGSEIFGNFVGAWKVPTNDPLCTYENMGSGRMGDMHLTSATSTWITDGYSLAELNLPTLSTVTPASSLPSATFAQNCIDILGNASDGLFKDDVDGDAHSGAFISSLVEYGGKVYIGGYDYFSGAIPFSMLGLFKVTPPLVSAVIGDTVQGWDGDGVWGTSTHAFTGHFADEIATEWQTALGGPVYFGGSSSIPIITRTTNGPSFIVIDPTEIDSDSVTGQGLLYYLDSSSTATMGEYGTSIAPDRWGSTAHIGGCVILNGTRTWLCVGRRGNGELYSPCYGAPDEINGNGCNGVIPPGGDPEHNGEGYHAPNYEFMYWLFDLNKLKAVKDGTGGWTHENVAPYEYGELTLPYENHFHMPGPVDYDPVNKRLHVMRLRAWGGPQNDGWPIGLVYQVP